MCKILVCISFVGFPSRHYSHSVFIGPTGSSFYGGIGTLEQICVPRPEVALDQ
ncbi:MAG TPA: hypothetical protein VLR29_09415 [Flavobacterium sp.]|nr:hypothetical protein [Flavobacterium sp.]